VMSAAPVSAQTAPAAQSGAASSEVVQLPEIMVTTASPVAKPKKAAKRKTSSSLASAAPAQEAGSAAAAVSVLQPLPGAIVDDQTFVSVTVATAREFAANGGPTLTDTLQYKPANAG
ncbi:hypothetical protein MXD81_14470, partial [Microbacteriaceae bacterium K1510]|nr:hypothetical protein [Microbacteriaceae bacterium K1510]